MKRVYFGLVALALAGAVAPLHIANAQVAQQTIAQTGYYNGQRFTSVTYTVNGDGTYSMTFHFEAGGQFTNTITNSAAFFQMWQRAREISGTDGDD